MPKHKKGSGHAQKKKRSRAQSTDAIPTASITDGSLQSAKSRRIKAPTTKKYVVIGDQWVEQPETTGTRAGSSFSAAAADFQREQSAAKRRSKAAEAAMAAVAVVQPARSQSFSERKVKSGERSPSSRAELIASAPEPKRARGASPSRPNAARLATEVAAETAAIVANRLELEALNNRVQTRKSAIESADRLRDERARLHAELEERQKLRREKTLEILELLEAPLEGFGEDAMWQLAMHEYSVAFCDETISGRQMGFLFRALAKTVRHPDELPRFRGLYELDALRDAYLEDARLCRELHKQLHIFKRLYCNMLSGFGRFRKVKVVEGETFIDLMYRTNQDAREWRPPGNPGKAPAALGVPASKVGGVYEAEWSTQSLAAYHGEFGQTISLRGVRKADIWGSRRYLKSIPEDERSQIEAHTTIWYKDQQSHLIQRTKALEHSFVKQRNTLQWDEKTIAHVAWSIISLTCLRAGLHREREVIACKQLPENEKGESKVGVHVCNANLEALKDLGVAIDTIDFVCSDGTAYNSSLNIKAKRHKGGAYAHLWTAAREKGHLLLFFITCLSHVAHNEVQKVCEAAGVCTRTSLLKHKGKRDLEVSKVRLRLPELLTDVVLAVKRSKGCVNYIRASEELERLGNPPDGVETRWGYWVLVAIWIAPATSRIELIVAFLLHRWLKAQGDNGILASDAELDEDATVSSTELIAKIETLKDEARKQLLMELINPEVRVWLSFLAIYGKRSVRRFLDYSQNDGPGVAFKAPRVIRHRLAYLGALASESDTAKDLERGCPWGDDFKPLRTMISLLPDAFAGVDVRGIVRKGAIAARDYFHKMTAAWRENPALAVLGIMDDKGNAVHAASKLLSELGKQGRSGFAQSMLSHLPDTADKSELVAAIEAASDGLGMLFQDEALTVIGRLAAQSQEKAQLVDVEGGKDLHAIMWRIGAFVPISNFFSETAVKTFANDLHGSQRKTEACALRLTASRHSAHVYSKTSADFKWASSQLGHNKELRVQEKSGIEEALRPVSLSGEALSALAEVSAATAAAASADDEEMTEADEESERAEGLGLDDEKLHLPARHQRAPGWPTNPKVTASAILNSIAIGDIIEVLWERDEDGTPRIHLARVVQKMKIKVTIRWLHEHPTEDDVYINCPHYIELENISLRTIWDTCSDVRLEPAGADGQQQRWRRAAEADAHEADALRATESTGEADSLSKDALLSMLEARRQRLAAANASAEAAKQVWTDKMDIGIRVNVALRDARLNLVKTPIEEEVPEAPQHGPANQRVSTVGYTSENDREWFSDAILANCNAVDARDQPEGAVPFRYQYPRAAMPESFDPGAPSIPQSRAGQRVLRGCDCVMLLPICASAHWHSIALIGPQKLVVHWEPFGSDINSDDGHALAAFKRAFECAPKADGWRLLSVPLHVQMDGYQCGPWAHWFRNRLLSYISDPERMAQISFADFLLQSPRVTQLTGLSRVQCATAGRANNKLMHEERARLRHLLLAGKRQGLLRTESAVLEAFKVNKDGTGTSTMSPIDLDEGMDGDDRF